jgi:hypothetical protein
MTSPHGRAWLVALTTDLVVTTAHNGNPSFDG